MMLSKSECGLLGYAASKKTRDMKKEALRVDYNKNPVLCRWCSTPLSYEDTIKKKVFCGSSCAARFNNNRKSKVPLPPRYRPRSVYLADRQAIKDLEIERGSVTHRQTLKRYVVRVTQQGIHKCSCCQNSEWNGVPIPLELDHIDGCAANNTPSNLCVLCPNCHAQTPTAKGKNKGRGRKTLGIKEGY